MAKYKIGYTSGTFDLFHIGHLNLLERAKEHCDYLIVGVNTEEWVYKRKGVHPVIPWDQRAEIVGALKCVDKVIVSNDMDMIPVWEKYNFDAFFLGDDWKGEAAIVKMEQELNSVGVDVVYFSYTKGISSTIIKSKMKNQ